MHVRGMCVGGDGRGERRPLLAAGTSRHLADAEANAGRDRFHLRRRDARLNRGAEGLVPALASFLAPRGGGAGLAPVIHSVHPSRLIAVRTG